MSSYSLSIKHEETKNDQTRGDVDERTFMQTRRATPRAMQVHVRKDEMCKCAKKMRCVRVFCSHIREGLFSLGMAAWVRRFFLSLNTTREAWRRPRRGFQRARHWSHFLGCCAQAQGRPLCLDKGGRTLSTGTGSVSGWPPRTRCRWAVVWHRHSTRQKHEKTTTTTHPLLLVPLLPVGLLNPRSCCPAFSLSQLLHPALWH